MSEKKPTESTTTEDSNAFQEMFHIQTLVGMAAYPVDYMIDNGAPSNFVEEYMAKMNIKLAEAVAKITGGNIEDIANKDKRTPEQERLMLEISGKDQLLRLERFLKSDYALSQDLIRDRYKSSMATMLQNRYKGRKEQNIDYFTEKMEKITNEEIIAIRHIALYFFATHKDIDPRKSGGIREKEKAELLSYLDKALKILESKSKNPRLSFTEAVDESIGIKFDTMLKLSSIIPQKHVIPNNKLSNTLTENIIDAGSYELVVAGKGKKSVTTICILTYEGDNVKLTGRQPYTEYDRNVYNAVTSLYVYGDKQHIVTPATVYRAMVSMKDRETPSNTQLEAVAHSLDKMRFIRARVDCTDELVRRGASIDGEQITGGKIDTYLLAAEAIEVEAGGKIVRAYRIIKTPILYEYSKLIKQVLTVSAGLLDIYEDGQRVKNTEQRIAIKGYLLRRIEVMNGKTSNKQSRNILFDGIYSVSGTDNPSDKEKERIRNYTFTVLDYWKKQGYIKDYESLRSGPTYTGIAIN